MSEKLPRVQKFKAPDNANRLAEFIDRINSNSGPPLIASTGKRMQLFELMDIFKEFLFLRDYGLPADERKILDDAQKCIETFADPQEGALSFVYELLIAGHTPTAIRAGLADSQKSLTDVVAAIDTVQSHISTRSEFLNSEIKRLQTLKPNTAAYKEEEEKIRQYILAKEAGPIEKQLEQIIVTRDTGGVSEFIKHTHGRAGSIPNILSHHFAMFKEYNEYDELATNAKSLLNAIKHRLPSLMPPPEHRAEKD